MTPLKYFPRFQRAYRDLETLAGRERWSRADVEALQLERVNHVWQHALHHVPYYQELAANHQLPQAFTSLDEFTQRVPRLTRSDVQSEGRRLLSHDPGRGRWHVTGGSTGQPARVFWTHDAHREQLRARYRYLAEWGLDIFDRTTYLWGHAASFDRGLAGRGRRWMQPFTDTLRRRQRLSAYDLSPHRLREYLRQIQRFRPTSLYAYSTAAYLLACEAEQCGFTCDSMKVVVLTSEPAPPRAVATIERALGVPVSLEYGSMECGFIAGQTPAGQLTIREDIVLVESPPRPDGRCDIVVTVLTNTAFPLLRYEIGDTTARPIERPAYGFARLHNITGRSNDLLVTAAGRCLHPTPLESAFEALPQVRRYSVRQDADGAVAIQLELTKPDDRFDSAPIKEYFEALLEGYPVSVECVDSLPLTSAGKHRWISSRAHLATGDVNDVTSSLSEGSYVS